MHGISDRQADLIAEEYASQVTKMSADVTIPSGHVPELGPDNRESGDLSDDEDGMDLRTGSRKGGHWRCKPSPIVCQNGPQRFLL